MRHNFFVISILFLFDLSLDVTIFKINMLNCVMTVIIADHFNLRATRVSFCIYLVTVCFRLGSLFFVLFLELVVTNILTTLLRFYFSCNNTVFCDKCKICEKCNHLKNIVVLELPKEDHPILFSFLFFIFPYPLNRLYRI